LKTKQSQGGTRSHTEDEAIAGRHPLPHRRRSNRGVAPASTLKTKQSQDGTRSSKPDGEKGTGVHGAGRGDHSDHDQTRGQSMLRLGLCCTFL